MKKMRSLFAFLFCAVLFTGCFTERISNQNLAYLYDHSSSFLHPEYNVVHLNDSLTQLHFRINSNELLYQLNRVSNFHSAVFRIRYEVYAQMESKVLADSAVMIFHDSTMVMRGRTITGVIDLKPSHNDQELLKVDLVDLRRNSRVVRYLDIERSNINCRQFFMVRDAENGRLLARTYLGADETVSISHTQGLTEATVSYYDREFPLPAPPFSVQSPKIFHFDADSTFQIDLKDTHRFPKEGFYHIQVSDSSRDGLTLFRWKKNFPEVKTVDAMIGPLRFINSNTEYTRISEAENRKKEVDLYWLNVAGSEDRARSLIRKYYARVEDANRHFTSHVKGWQSDRGLIYLIYGPPNIIYKNTGSEQWIYGDEGNPSSLGLTFYKMENPFSDNDYRLDRSPIYKSSWYNAVDLWRQGRIYSDR